MIENEIKFHQSKYFECVSNYLDENICYKKEFAAGLNDACKDKNKDLAEFYTPYLEKATLNKKFYNKKVLDKIGQAYLNLGRYGYNHNLCKSL